MSEQPEPKSVLLLQCLCPQRHCIMAFVGEQPPETAESIAQTARDGIEAAIASGTLNGWCALCRAQRETWQFEVKLIPDTTLEALMPALKRQEAEQLRSQAAILADDRHSRN